MKQRLQQKLTNRSQRTPQKYPGVSLETLYLATRAFATMISNMIETFPYGNSDRPVVLFQTGFSHIYVKGNINI